MSKFLVIDGLDGSGKGSVTRMLRAYLTEKGIGNDLISFPMYENESSSLVKLYFRESWDSSPTTTTPMPHPCFLPPTGMYPL